VTSWNYAKPLDAPYFGKGTSFAKTFNKAKRLAEVAW
jgi:hypothetical protein